MHLPDKLTIEITQRDIDSGQAVDCFRCPAAIAANRALSELGFDQAHAEVTAGCIEVTNDAEDIDSVYHKTEYLDGPADDALFVFVCDFDGDERVKPVSITLYRKPLPEAEISP